MGPKMSNTHDGDEKIPTPSTLGRIRVKSCQSLFKHFQEEIKIVFAIGVVSVVGLNFILFLDSQSVAISKPTVNV